MTKIKPKKLRKVLKDTLKHKHTQGIGCAKNQIKDAHNSTHFIHSDATYKTYVQQVDRFVDWMYERGQKYYDENTIDEFVQWYIQDQIDEGKSAFTISTSLCAIAKALDRTTTSFNINLPKRHRADIKRSRMTSTGDKGINLANYKDVITLCCCFGFRKHKELEQLDIKDIFQKDGNIYAKVIGKGGKPRTIQAYFKDETERKDLVRILNEAYRRGGLIYPKVPNRLDIHSYRGVYARRVYEQNARPIESLSKKDKYVCRSDRKGDIYDKQALRIASQMLGHNRECVVVDNYLR